MGLPGWAFGQANEVSGGDDEEANDGQDEEARIPRHGHLPALARKIRLAAPQQTTCVTTPRGREVRAHAHAGAGMTHAP